MNAQQTNVLPMNNKRAHKERDAYERGGGVGNGAPGGSAKVEVAAKLPPPLDSVLRRPRSPRSLPLLLRGRLLPPPPPPPPPPVTCGGKPPTVLNEPIMP